MTTTPHHPKDWNLDEIRNLRLLYGSNSDTALARIFGCSEEDIASQAAVLALAKDKRTFRGVRKMPRWTAAEIDVLRERYAKTPNRLIALELNKSTKSVASKAQQLELTKNKERLREMGLENRALRRQNESGAASS